MTPQMARSSAERRREQLRAAAQVTFLAVVVLAYGLLAYFALWAVAGAAGGH